ncbi:MAG: glycosyltransferase family 2 protein [Treponema sp.]|nr:glycosyltransferase family 2 protein [Candidatus Treponema equi]
MNRFAFLVPVYRHGSTLDYVVSSLLRFNFPVIVVDDGNGEEDKKYINECAAKYSQVVLVVRPKNGGKGRAVNDGVRKAFEIGATHVLQVDSDGQHDIGQVEHFLELSRQHPDAVVCSYPEYDESAPKARLRARKFANLWVHIVTVSKKIKDGLIGFRLYPVAPYMKLLKNHAMIDTHMGYDIDILVRLVWKGVPLVQSPVKVSYPKDGVSNFRVVRDNVHISMVYTKLCIGMVFRLPVLLFRKIRNGNTING